MLAKNEGYTCSTTQPTGKLISLRVVFVPTGKCKGPRSHNLSQLASVASGSPAGPPTNAAYNLSLILVLFAKLWHPPDYIFQELTATRVTWWCCHQSMALHDLLSQVILSFWSSLSFSRLSDSACTQTSLHGSTLSRGGWKELRGIHGTRRHLRQVSNRLFLMWPLFWFWCVDGNSWSVPSLLYLWICKSAFLFPV